MQDGVSKYRIPKKACQGLVHLKLPERQGTKYCVLCKKHGERFKSHNMCNWCCFNKDGTPIKNRGGTSRTQPTKKGPKGMNFMQLMRTKIKKALHKHTCKDKKFHSCKADSNSDTENSSWRDGSSSTGESVRCKKRKLNSSLKNYTYPSPSRAIHNTKSKFSNILQIDIATKNKSKKFLI